MSNHLLVSTVIPTFNRGSLVTRAVKSAIRESQDGDEIIVVDDGSTDDTEERLRPYFDRIRYIKTENGGAGRARNRGIQEAQNPLIAFLDSDDEWMEGKLKLCRNLMEARSDILYCFSNMAVTHADGRTEGCFLINWHNDERPWDEILAPGIDYSLIANLPDNFHDFKVYIGDMYLNLARAIYVVTSTTVVRKYQAGEALHFEPEIPTYEDWLCFGRLAKVGKGAYMDIETAWQHGHDSSRLTDADSLINAQTRIKILERLWGQDEDFLRNHQGLYQELLKEQRLNIVADLIFRGKTAEARQELALLPSTALVSYRALAQLPGWIVKGLLRIRKVMH